VACLKGVCCLIPVNYNSESGFRKEGKISYKNNIKLHTGLFYFIFNFTVRSLSILDMLPITLAHHPPKTNIRGNACPQKLEQLHHQTPASI